ncbi:MAG: hypothetical protein K2Y37_01345 [Pirellulales bacterium]|nr:hypothetical protein [Pirellulales bacterium]
MADRPLLVRAGWTDVGTGRGSYPYAYVSPPEGSRGSNTTIPLQVPTDEEILAIALQMHQRRERLTEVVEGFVVDYRPPGEVVLQISETFVFQPGRPWGERLGPSPPVLREFAEFTFGVGAAWGVDLVWERGEDQPPVWRRRDGHVVDATPGPSE